jgi:hypothetical protein
MLAGLVVLIGAIAVIAYAPSFRVSSTTISSLSSKTRTSVRCGHSEAMSAPPESPVPARPVPP